MNICGTGVLCQHCKAVSRCKVIFATVIKEIGCVSRGVDLENGAKQDSLGGQTLRVTSSKMNWSYLVDGFKHLLFSITYGIILPIDEYFSRWLNPPTSYSFMTVHAMLMHVFGTTTCWIELVHPDSVCQGRRYNMKRIRNMRRTQTSSNVPYPDTTFNASFKHLDYCFPWFSPPRNCSPAVLIGTQSRPARTNPCLYCYSLAMVFFLCSRLNLKYPNSPQVFNSLFIFFFQNNTPTYNWSDARNSRLRSTAENISLRHARSAQSPGCRFHVLFVSPGMMPRGDRNTTAMPTWAWYHWVNLGNGNIYCISLYTMFNYYIFQLPFKNTFDYPKNWTHECI